MKFTMLKLIPVIVFSAAFIGCGGATDSVQQSNENAPPPIDNEDTGPVSLGSPANEKVQSYRESVWTALAPVERCGGCHAEDGLAPDTLWFVGRDDINEAYADVLPLIDEENTGESLLVSTVRAGHNPWPGLTADATADSILLQINTWLTVSGDVSTEIVLTRPLVLRETEESVGFAASNERYEATIGALIRGEAGCAGCHAEGTTARQQPFFGSINLDTAYSEAQSLINIQSPAASRFIQRVRDENHNRWSDPNGMMTDAEYSTQQMTAAVMAFLDESVEPSGVVRTVVDTTAVRVSNAAYISDGVVASGGGRIDSNAIALYQFKEGVGSVAQDTSGVDPIMNLNLLGDVDFIGSWGIRISDNGIAIADASSSEKLHDQIQLTGEYSIEAWVVPANVTQEEARIVTYSAGQNIRNFSLNQTLYDYDFLARTDLGGDENGMPILNTPSAEEVLQATLQHVVATYDPVEGRKIYVNGELRARDPEGYEGAGSLNEWDDSYVFAVGNEIGTTNDWEGTVRFLAIHNRALSQDQVVANFDVGVGQKYYVMFNVEDHTGVTDSYVVFQVEQYDDYSYLFSNPFFIMLDDDAQVPNGSFSIEGIRIGINGKEAPVGQAFANVNVTITGGENGNYSPETGTPLATNPAGTLIGLENGPDQDLFYLTFDSINGNNSEPREEEEYAPLDDVPDDEQSNFGVRMFDEVFNNMSFITGVPTEDVYDFYLNQIRRSLPAATAPNGFLASQQSAVTQLALRYCTTLVENATYRSAFFGSPGYGSVSSQGEIDTLVDTLLDRMLVSNTNLTQHSDAAAMRLVLDNANPTADQPQGLVQALGSATANEKAAAACTSVLGSAIMLMQ